MTERIRRRWTADDKLRLVLESMQSEQNVTDLCSREGLNPTQIYGWRKQLQASAQEVFGDKRGQRQDEDPRLATLVEENQKLKNVIAELTIENRELRKGLDA